jgi:hypothetical protein
MAWKTEIGMIVRHLIGDVDYDNSTYSEDRIHETILVCAQLVNAELDFANTYTIDVDQCTLSPDPTVGTKDDGFINLVALKAACLILNSEFRTSASKAFNIVDGPSRIDGRDVANSQKELAKNMCGLYEDAKKAYRVGNLSVGAAIVGPYRI